jgi:hypothetical protein
VAVNFIARLWGEMRRDSLKQGGGALRVVLPAIDLVEIKAGRFPIFVQ